MTDLAPILPRLERLIPRLASDQDGEVVATARAIDRTLRTLGADWFDVVAALAPAAAPARPAPTPRPASADAIWRKRAEWCLDVGGDLLTPRDREFLGELLRRGSRGAEPSDKQARWLGDLWARVEGRA